jgi:hypothetical protein
VIKIAGFAILQNGNWREYFAEKYLTAKVQSFANRHGIIRILRDRWRQKELYIQKT